MTCLRGTPAPQYLSLQLRQLSHQLWLVNNPRAVLSQNLIACSISANHERIAPFRRTANVHVIRVSRAMHYFHHIPNGSPDELLIVCLTVTHAVPPPTHGFADHVRYAAEPRYSRISIPPVPHGQMPPRVHGNKKRICPPQAAETPSPRVTAHQRAAAANRRTIDERTTQLKEDRTVPSVADAALCAFAHFHVVSGHSRTCKSSGHNVKWIFFPRSVICFRKNATPALRHWSRKLLKHARSVPLALEPDSPPAMTQ